MEPFDQVEKTYKEFKLLKIVPINELQSTLREFEHIPTGAHLMHLENEDNENVFSLSFKTLPSNSNGAAHIVEHTVLCGSEKFPVKDPFFAMTRRSLHTYMNALTGPDFTCYPAASQVPKDFYNLLEVYLDAVFKPYLKELSFLQEGHRLEFLEPENKNTPLVHKGIVFNEMKGALSSADSRLWKKMMQSLFPTLPYGFNAGGNPEEIAHLTYGELLEFYKTYYHPSRCLFYFYGNIPIQKHLDFLAENTLKDVEKKEQLPPPTSESRFKEPKFITSFYPKTEEDSEDKIIFALGFLTCPIKNQRDSLAIQVLDLVLMGTDASPLKQVLLKSHLCKQADSYIDTDMTEIPFVFICKGCTEESAKQIRPLILKTLQDIVKNGIDNKLIEAAIHQLEFSRSEITGSTTPFGLSLFFRSALLKQHGVDPEEGLKIHSLFDNLREHTSNPHFLKNLITTYLLENSHQVELTMKPDKDLLEKELQEENEELKKIKENLSDEDAEKLILQTKKLNLFQEEQEHANLEILPKVTLNDVSPDPRDFLLTKESMKGIELFHHECFTNHIVYVDLHFKAPPIAVEDLPYLRLFCLFLTEIGSKERTYQENLEYIQENIGSIHAFFSLHIQGQDAHQCAPTFGFKGKALKRKVDHLIFFMKEMLSHAQFDEKVRIKELLEQHHSQLENSLISSALKYALSYSTSSFTPPSYISDSLYGFNYFISVRKIVKEFEKDPSILIKKLQMLQEKLLGLKDLKIVVSSDKESYEYLREAHFPSLLELCKKEAPAFKTEYSIPKVESQGRIISAPIAFNSMSLPIISYAHPDAALLSIAAQLFENKVLHKKIREQGGAYGGGASSNTLVGHLSFYSYRDPSIALSLEAFKDAVHEVLKGSFNERDIEDAKLGLLQDLDGPIAPGQRAATAFSWLLAGKTFEMRRQYRTTLLLATKEEIQRAVKEHIFPKLQDAVVITFAGESLLNKEKTQALNTFPIYQV